MVEASGGIVGLIQKLENELFTYSDPSEIIALTHIGTRHELIGM